MVAVRSWFLLCSFEAREREKEKWKLVEGRRINCGERFGDGELS